MDRLLAQDAIQRLVISINRAEDELDFKLFESCFLPGQKMTLDLTEHLPGTSKRDLDAEEFWKELMASIPGFTATHHQLGPLQFAFHDSKFTKATASATVTATYALEEEGGKSSSIVVKGLQSADVEKVEGRWGIRCFKIVRHVLMENLHLFGVAGERVAKGLGRVVKK